MESQMNSDSTSFLYKSLRRLYIYAQIFGFASFSYSRKFGVHMKFINIITLLSTTLFYSAISFINSTTELTVGAKGYQGILFYAGLRVFFVYAPFLLLSSIFLLFLSRKKIAKLMEEIMALNSEVR